MDKVKLNQAFSLGRRSELPWASLASLGMSVFIALLLFFFVGVKEGPLRCRDTAEKRVKVVREERSQALVRNCILVDKKTVPAEFGAFVGALVGALGAQAVFGAVLKSFLWYASGTKISEDRAEERPRPRRVKRRRRQTPGKSG